MQRDEIASHPGCNRVARFKTFAGTVRGVLILTLIVAGLAYLVFVQPAFLLAILPFSVLLLCPLLHVFMHRGHGNQSGHQH